MSNALVRRLAPAAETRSTLSKLLDPVKTVSDFLADTIEAFKELKDGNLAKAVGDAVPWLEFVTEPVVDAVPPVKFAAKLLGELGREHHPEVLAYFACTTAYQRSIEQATAVLPPSVREELQQDVTNALEYLRKAEDGEVKLQGFTFSGALSLPFVAKADGFLADFARLVGYNKQGVASLMSEVHARFPSNLKMLLSHGKTREKFASLSQHLEFGGGEEALVHEAILIHADYQRRQFEEDRVLGREPFSLADVYVDIECGVLTWDQVRRMPDPKTGKPCKPNPFDQAFGGRHSLLATTLKLLKDPDFNDAIVIQGVAGSGKSTFTLRLCTELVREGFRPIRVRLRDVVFDRPPRDSLARAVRLSEEGNEQPLPRPEHKFLEGKIFEDSVHFGKVRMCPYILVLDGWDEISIAADEGFKKRVNDFLEKIRDEYLRNRQFPVRLVVTGRPTTDVTFENSPFFTNKTRLLTIRELSPEGLHELVDKTAVAVNAARLGWIDDADRWSAPEAEARRALVERYTRGTEERAYSFDSMDQPSVLSIVGLPLLTHMTVRLLAERGEQVVALLQAPTTLYRRLTDLTCDKSAKYPDDDLEPTGRYRIAGQRLRHLLHLTATAMTIQGQESISHDDLEKRIARLGLPLGGNPLHEYAAKTTKSFPTASLIISYFFKGGRTEFGCEFVHKSFREYLFAEAIVEVLKNFAEGPAVKSRYRSRWWGDFEEGDPRHTFSRTLGPRLAAQWLSQDEVEHIASLIRWEVERAKVEQGDGDARTTRRLPIEQWKKVRDGLADLWEWWAEGVHLRPTVERQRNLPRWEQSRLLACDLVRDAYPVSLPDYREIPAPVRITTVDAHLGDGLFRICALVHSALHSGGTSRGSSPTDDGLTYQSRCTDKDGQHVIVFRPDGPSPGFLRELIARINGAGWRRKQFPALADMSFVDLSQTSLSGVDLSNADLRNAYLCKAYLVEANLSYADLSHADLSETDLGHANLYSAKCIGAYFDSADLGSANLSFAELNDAVFADANLMRANLVGADLTGSDLRGADLSGAQLNDAVLDGILVDADTRLEDAVLSEELRDMLLSQIDQSSKHGRAK